MFELTITTPTENHMFSTCDFLQLCCDVGQTLGPFGAGDMVTKLLLEHAEELECLRVIDWDFKSTNEGITVSIRKVV